MYRYAMLCIGGFSLLFLLLVIYKSKPRYLSIENKLFNIVLVSLAFCMGLEVVSYFTMFYSREYPVLNELVCRFAYGFAIIYVGAKECYFLCLHNNANASNIFDLLKANWKYKFMFAVIIGTIFIFLILPFDYHFMDSSAYLTGPAYYFIYAYGSILTTTMLIYTIVNHKRLEFKKSSQVYYIFLVSIITIPLQMLFPHIAISTCGFCIDVFILYFSLENPDLQLIEELDEARRLADESNNAKSDFLSNMSHEIRSPMNAIIGFSESILNSENFNEEEVRKDIANIKTAGSGLIDIINNILDISKIENGKENLNECEYSIKDICLDLLNIIETRIGHKKIKLIFEIDENLPSVLYGDKTKVYQIILNILTNAVKYTEVGKIFLRINGEVIDDKVELYMSVEDTGYGIKKEDYDKLFSKFVRLDDATNNDIEGTGLGLVITKKMVTLLNGDITFTSDYEVGTTFDVKINQKIIDFTPLGKINTKVNNTIDYELIDCSKYSVMIVDNNKLNLKVIERLLEHYKFKITPVSSGSECIYKIKEGNKYDMIFLDHMMPDMDGIEVLNILKSLDSYDIPPVVALTANAITGMKEKYISEGFDEYLPKPINNDELNRLINKYFKEDKDV